MQRARLPPGYIENLEEFEGVYPRYYGGAIPEKPMDIAQVISETIAARSPSKSVSTAAPRKSLERSRSPRRRDY